MSWDERMNVSSQRSRRVEIGNNDLVRLLKFA